MPGPDFFNDISLSSQEANAFSRRFSAEEGARPGFSGALVSAVKSRVKTSADSPRQGIFWLP